jgi:hypothetical protein
MNSKLAPTDAFPDDLAVLNDADIQILHSRLQRQVDHEYTHAFQTHPETEFRLAEVLEELDHRERYAPTAYRPDSLLV